MDHFRSKKQTKKRIINRLILLFLGCLISFFILKILFNKDYSKTPAFEQTTIALPEIPQKENAPETKEIAKEEDNNQNEKAHVITFKKGDSLARVFKKLNLSNQTLQQILKNNPHTKYLTKINAGQKLEFIIKDNTLEKLTVPLNIKELLVITRHDLKFISTIEKRKMTVQDCYVSANVQSSIYNTAKKLNISYKLIKKMSDIFSWEIDFSKDVRSGDQFTILYKGYFIEDKLVEIGDIVALTYKNQNKTLEAVGKLNANNQYEYFTPNGISLTKAFTRYPIKFSHISSHFSLARKHPTLNVVRPHKGVDLAAPIGTPIKATGDGRIKILGNQSGYGNMIKIEHNKTYSSVYAHMLKFEKGLSVGRYVKRGQVIGYVGQSGVATGPHCHYEFHINKQPKNPTTVDLPRASPIAKSELAQFKAKALTLMASINLYEQAKYARLENKKNITA